MRKILLPVFFVMIFFCGSCQKEKCKEQQTKDLQRELDRFQKEIDNHNLTQEQIAAITLRHEKKQTEILAECN